MRAATRVVLGIILSCAVSHLALARNVNVPDWMRQAASVNPGPLPPEVKAVWLLDQTDYKVTGPGEYIEHSRAVLKILRPEGRKYGNPEVDVHKGEKILSLHAWTVDSSGNNFELKEKDFLEKSEFTYELYSDYVERVANAPALGPGTVVGFEYEVKRKEWINELGWLFQSEFPVVESIMSVDLPPGWEYRASWSSGTPLEPTRTGPNAWEWRMKNVPGIIADHEPMMPSYLALAGRMSVAYYSPEQKSATSATWTQVGKWYSDLVTGKPIVTPEIASKTQTLIAGAPDFPTKLSLITSFVQSEIRYVAIEIGIGGNQPHFSGEVFSHRYGDCKDKVTLLKAMLEAAGVHSNYVLVDTHRGFINPSVPSSWGNHAIIAIELPPDVDRSRYPSLVETKSGKRYIIFDPTDEYTPVGSLRSELQSSYALIVTENGGELIHTPLLPPDSNKVVRQAHFVLSADGALSAEVNEDRSGDFAMEKRYELHYSDQHERTMDFEQWLGRSVQGFKVSGMDFQQVENRRNDVLVKYQFSTPQYAQIRGPLMLIRPRVLDDKSEYVERKPRQYPVELKRPRIETDTYEIDLPQGYVIDDLPQGTKIDVGFAKYESKTEAVGSKLRYWRQYTVRDLSVPPEKYADWTRLQGAIGADETAVAVLKRAQ